MKRKLLRFILYFTCLGGALACSSGTGVTVGAEGELLHVEISRLRDLSTYSQGGHFVCCRRDDWPPPQEVFIRNFIWQHWMEKRRGYVRLSTRGVDNSFTTHYLVEPNEEGHWVVVWIKLHKHSIPEYDTLRLRKGVGVPTRVAANELPDGWRLEFVTVSGEGANPIPGFSYR